MLARLVSSDYRAVKRYYEEDNGNKLKQLQPRNGTTKVEDAQPQDSKCCLR